MYKKFIKKFELKIKPFTENKNYKLIKFLDFKKLILLEKKKLIELISNSVEKNITMVKSIFLGQKKCFGNQLKIIYKTIFYCQILKCKKIILDKKYNWYIKKRIINKKYKMIIEINKRKNINKFVTIIDKTSNFFFYSKYIQPTFRINLLRKELLKHIPKISVNYNDLFIYIRSGDIFIKPYRNYKQPPLCFYKKVLDYFIFNKIYLIAVNKNNPVIEKLLKNYPNIIYNFNSLKIDISYIVNAYNIVGGAYSTFLSRILELNNDINFLWTFKSKSFHFKKYLKFKLNSFYIINKAKIFLLFASNNYIREMAIWNNTKEQRDLMINDDCPYPFILIS